MFLVWIHLRTDFSIAQLHEYFDHPYFSLSKTFNFFIPSVFKFSKENN